MVNYLFIYDLHRVSSRSPVRQRSELFECSREIRRCLCADALTVALDGVDDSYCGLWASPFREINAAFIEATAKPYV